MQQPAPATRQGMSELGLHGTSRAQLPSTYRLSMRPPWTRQVQVQLAQMTYKGGSPSELNAPAVASKRSASCFV
jgi:hypothetical protein